MEESLARIADSLESISINLSAIAGMLLVINLTLVCKNMGGGYTYILSEIKDNFKKFVSTYIERR